MQFIGGDLLKQRGLRLVDVDSHFEKRFSSVAATDSGLARILAEAADRAIGIIDIDAALDRGLPECLIGDHIELKHVGFVLKMRGILFDGFAECLQALNRCVDAKCREPATEHVQTVAEALAVLLRLLELVAQARHLGLCLRGFRACIAQAF
jgi:hypothetical protein